MLRATSPLDDMAQMCFRYCFYLALLGCVACSPRITIREARPAAAAQSAFDGELVFADSLMQVGYSFWSPGGAPWVTVSTDAEELLIDLRKSYYLLGATQYRLHDSGFLTPDGLGFRERFAGCEIRRVGTERYAVVPRARWIGFELPALANGTSARPGFGGSRRHRLQNMAVHLVVQRPNGRYHDVTHHFVGHTVEQISEQDFEDYERNRATDAHYYERPDAEAAAVWIDLALQLANLFIFF